MLPGYAELRGTLAEGPDRLLKAFRLGDDLGQLSYRIWYYAGLTYDQDQRDNAANARRQKVQILFAKAAEARSWFTPELLRIPLATVTRLDGRERRAGGVPVCDRKRRITSRSTCSTKRASICCRSSSRFGDDAARRALDAGERRHQASASSRCTTAEQVTLTYGQYNALLQTNRHQPDRAAAFHAFHETFAANANTFAAVYNGVLQRDWFVAQARQFTSTLEAALHGNDIPPAVVENLVATAKAGSRAAAPLSPAAQARARPRDLPRLRSARAAHRLRSEVPGTAEVLDEIVESMKPLGPDYQRSVRQAFEGRWIDVYENPGKRSGAYSAPVYGVHPYMLLNYNDTLDSVFTLAHEMGHSMHTMLSEAHQPFVYSDYTIFVAEVPSTLSEMLFFDHMLTRTTDQRERIVLLQHAIDDIVGTFYRQCLFADYELQAHRLAEQGEPITAEALSRIYFDLFKAYHGDCDDVRRLGRRSRGRACRISSGARTTSINTRPVMPRRRS